ncbi:hypothetical protein EJ06DRAFT_533943 [Trichodelitschia bisporula]|uniref:CTLH domain-containing protein n=1 Tax=Trichodelitschia bisporula TaxID=703511 RepID=A0A6G1HLF3_9PEZI|nr:hypothetical protein EJ06DRAFT_533943 [Trichodelitschia bisporula]
MSFSTVSPSTPTRHSFERRVEEHKPSKMDINAVIMDYLIKEGYPNSARKFAVEANVKPAPDEESMQARVEIRNAINAGNIQTAIERINELNPEILERDGALHFALLRLQLIELIRTTLAPPSTDIMPALNFATTQLAPRASTNREFLDDLEKTMALLVFSTETLMPQLSELLNPDLRLKVADRVNSAILRSQGAHREAKIKEWVRARKWSEQEARRSKKDIPARMRLGLDGEEVEEDDDEVMNGNGEDTDML